MEGEWHGRKVGRHSLGGGNNYDYPASLFKERWLSGQNVSLFPWVCWSEQTDSVLSDLNLRCLIQASACLSVQLVKIPLKPRDLHWGSVRYSPSGRRHHVSDTDTGN